MADIEIVDRRTPSPSGGADPFGTVRGALTRPRLRSGAWLVGSIAVWAVAAAVLPKGLPAGTVALGALAGGLSALTAVGLVIIYRSSRIINFAQAEIGGLAATLAILLVTRRDVSYFVAVPLGMGLALGTGALVEVAVVRRLFRAPRLILTVATIGVAQILTAGAGFLNNWIDAQGAGTGAVNSFLARGFGLPFSWTVEIRPVLFNADAVLVVMALPLVLFGLNWFFNRTDSGIGVRGAADSQERAELLGIPVRRLSLLTWTVAGGLSGLAVLLTAGVRGYGVTGVSGPKLLLAPLAAAVIARFDKLPVAVWASVAIGVFSDAVYWNYSRPSTVDAAIFVLILVALLFQVRGSARVAGEELGGFVAVRELRRVPDAVRRLPEVRAAAAVLFAVLGFVVLVLPLLLPNARVIIFTFTAIYAIIGVSLVVLTGWSGQLTFGQFAFVGLGAATAGSLLVHAEVDYLLCLVAAAGVGAASAIVIGIPALRIPGLFLAPVTLAFAVAVASYVLNANNFSVFNPVRVPRPLFLERIDLGTPRAFYYFCVGCLVLTIVLARNFRRRRAGRAVVGVQNNERMAASFSISPTRMKLTAFALSGAMAGLAGGLYVLAIYGVPPEGFGLVLSQQVFAMVVVGGLTSITGGVLGAVYVYGAQYLFAGPLQIAVTGAGMLVVLMIVPGGLAEVLAGRRDRFLRWALKRNNMAVHGFTDSDEEPVVPTHLIGVDETCRVEDLVEGGDAWKRVWAGLDKVAKKRVRRTADRGKAAQPPEYAAIAVGRVMSRRRLLMRFFMFLPVVPLIVWLQLAGFATLSGSRGFVDTFWDQLGRPFFWINQAVNVVVFPLLTLSWSFSAERLNRAIVVDAAASGTVTRPASAHDDLAQTMLRGEDLDAGYGHLQILFGLNIDVRQGEVLALLGTNGAGKTTTLRALSGLIAPTRGRVVFDGEDITHLPAIERVKKGIVMVPARGIFGSLSVEENLRLASWLAARDGDTDFIASSRARVFELFPVLEERLAQRASLLSGGEQQMLAIAQALLCRPRVLMIDEMSLGLAPIVVAGILEVVRELNATGITVIAVEQSVNLSTTIAERAHFMEKGKIRYSGPTNDLATSDLLHSVFVGTEEPTGSAGDGALSKLAAAAAKRNDQRRREAALVPDGADDRVFLRAEGLKKRYGGVTAVSDFTLDVQHHEVLGIIGANGAGKTSAFDIMSGFVRADSGTLTFSGRDITTASPAERAALGFGRTFQDVRMMPSLTAAESLAVALERHLAVREPIACIMNLAATQRSEETVRERVDELLAAFGLERWRDTFVADLSTGTRRVLELTCAAAHEPALLLLDEPTSGLAQPEAEAMAGVLLDLKERIGATVLIIEHDVPLVSAVSDELVCMHLGAVIARGPSAAVLSDPKVITSYLGGDEATIYRSGSAKASGNGSGGNGSGNGAPTLTVGEFAALRDLTTATVLRRIRQNRITATRDGRRWVIPSSELERDLTLTTTRR